MRIGPLEDRLELIHIGAEGSPERRSSGAASLFEVSHNSTIRVNRLVKVFSLSYEL